MFGRALGDVHGRVEGDGAALRLDELDVDALALERRDRLGVGVHHVALALLEQAGHRRRQADRGDLGQHLLELDQGRIDVGQRAAELLGDLDQRRRAEGRLEAGQAEPRHPRVLQQVGPALGRRHLLRIVGDAHDLGADMRRRIRR